MKSPFIVGQKIYLRGIEREDITAEYFQWLNDYEVTRYLDSGAMPNTEESAEQYYLTMTKSPNDVLLAIVEKKTDRHIGNGKLGSINWTHRSADFGIMVGSKDCWGQGYGTEATGMILDYGFNRLNLNKVVSGFVADNKASIRACEKVGFRREGLISEMLYVDGNYQDKVIMGVTRNEFDSSDWQRSHD